jgi:hypothetical protein
MANSSLVIDHLSSKFETSDNVFVAFFYCDYRDREQQTIVNMIGGLLKQAITALRKPSSEFIGPLLKTKKGRNKLDLEDALGVLSQILREFDRVYICIDALDECTEEPRRDLIRCLKGLSNPDPTESEPVEIRLFVTGRPHIKDYVVTHFAIAGSLIPLAMELKTRNEDIAAYINYKLKMDTGVKMDEDFKKQIVSEILSTSQGM